MHIYHKHPRTIYRQGFWTGLILGGCGGFVLTIIVIQLGWVTLG